MELTPNWLAIPVLMPLIAAALMLVVFRLSRSYSLLIQRSIAAVALTFNLGLALVFTAYAMQQNVYIQNNPPERSMEEAMR